MCSFCPTDNDDGATNRNDGDGKQHRSKEDIGDVSHRQ